MTLNRVDTGPCFKPRNKKADKHPCPRCKGAGHVLLESVATNRAAYSRALICCLCGGSGVARPCAQ